MRAIGAVLAVAAFATLTSGSSTATHVGSALWLNGGAPADTAADSRPDLETLRRLGTSPGDGGFSVRWDLTPGPGLFTEAINIQDLTSLISVRPPMLGYSLANNGPLCPWAP